MKLYSLGQLPSVVKPTGRPVRRLRFGEDDPKPKGKPEPKPTAWYLKPLVKVAAYLYTNPKPFAGLINPMLPTKHLKLYSPIVHVDFPSVDGVKLKGRWMPAKSPSTRTIVMGHGYTNDWRTMLSLAEKVREKGYNVFAFDFRGHGDSDGKTTIGFHEGKDVAAAVQYVKNNYAPYAEKTVYLGHSMGAVSVMATPKSLEGHPEALAAMTRHLDAIVLDSPYADLQAMANRFLGQMDSLEPKDSWVEAVKKVISGPAKALTPDLIEGFNQESKTILGADFKLHEMRPADIMKTHGLSLKPILVIHGKQDHVTPHTQGHQVFTALQEINPSARFLTLPYESHINSYDPSGGNGDYLCVLRDEKRYLTQLHAFLDDTLDKKEKTA